MTMKVHVKQESSVCTGKHCSDKFPSVSLVLPVPALSCSAGKDFGSLKGGDDGL